MNTLLPLSLLSVLALGTPQITYAQDCTDPANPDCISTNAPPVNNQASTYTNLVGVPVISFSLSTSAFTNFTSVSLFSTNTGFIITPTNTIFVVHTRTTNQTEKYFFGTWSVINTSTNRSWQLQARIGGLEDGGGSFWSGWYSPFNGTGTNLYTHQGWYLAEVPVNYFRVMDVGPAD